MHVHEWVCKSVTTWPIWYASCDTTWYATLAANWQPDAEIP